MTPLRRPLCLLALAGLLAGRGQAADEAQPPGRVVELPPLMVAEAASGQAWRYVQAPGLEVLSRCTDNVTIHLVEEMARLKQLVAVILPEELQARRLVPDIAVIYSEENRPVVAPEVVEELLQAQRAAGGEDRRFQGEVRYRSMPNLRLTDRDAMDVFFILQEKEFLGSQLTLTSEYIRYVVKNRTPAPPAWFIEGVVDLFNAGILDSSSVALGPLEWQSVAETQKIRKDPDFPRAVLPLTELFSSAPVPEANLALWRAQALLFLRWSLDGKDHSRRDALWKFIARASAAPVTEEMFRECFGLGYVDAQDRMSDYLTDTAGLPLRLNLDKKTELPRLTPRLATDLEIARIKGDWERLEISYIKPRYPQLAPKYADQARRTLMRAYDKGERDPRLLAVLGLCECDAGNDAAARQFLEAAVQGGVVRPRAHYELARLRYAEAQAALAAPGAPLTPAQANTVLQPLAAAWRQAPPLLEMYVLTAEVWSRSTSALTRQNLAVLDEGAAYFPRNALFIYQVAWLNARQGFKAEAEALIARGLQTGPNAALQARFEQLRSTLAAATPPKARP